VAAGSGGGKGEWLCWDVLLNSFNKLAVHPRLLFLAKKQDQALHQVPAPWSTLSISRRTVGVPAM
jgi:hypothetical protein